ncbi:uncharacterized protein LOC112495125 [Cephus cinctus]|uniref:Uncharacterized protein LOC112495125 n=1 Tax=Cephus cinctus TaxID=211228 RepID=A0AAJ7W6A9_CEPCN|nr:uncharacterized protein LOC112495125 [Cephus cinctus]
MSVAAPLTLGRLLLLKEDPVLLDLCNGAFYLTGQSQPGSRMHKIFEGKQTGHLMRYDVTLARVSKTHINGLYPMKCYIQIFCISESHDTKSTALVAPSASNVITTLRWGCIVFFLSST